ncbi:unnamed protein product [Arctogadus glacialis]
MLPPLSPDALLPARLHTETSALVGLAAEPFAGRCSLSAGRPSVPARYFNQRLREMVRRGPCSDQQGGRGAPCGVGMERANGEETPSSSAVGWGEEDDESATWVEFCFLLVLR